MRSRSTLRPRIAADVKVQLPEKARHDQVMDCIATCSPRSTRAAAAEARRGSHCSVPHRCRHRRSLSAACTEQRASARMPRAALCCAQKATRTGMTEKEMYMQGVNCDRGRGSVPCSKPGARRRWVRRRGHLALRLPLRDDGSFLRHGGQRRPEAAAPRRSHLVVRAACSAAASPLRAHRA